MRFQDGPLKRFLHLAPAAPAPAGNGLAMRCSSFLEALAKLGPVDLVVLNGAAPNQSGMDYLNRHANRVLFVSTVPLDEIDAGFAQASSKTERLSALQRLNQPTHSAGLTPAVLQRIDRLLGGAEYDLTVVSRSYAAPVVFELERRQKIDVISRYLGPNNPAALMQKMRQWQWFPKTAFGNRKFGKIVIDLDDDDYAYFRELSDLCIAEQDSADAEWNLIEANYFDALIAQCCLRADLVTLANKLASEAIAKRHHCNRLEVVPNSIEVPEETNIRQIPEMLFVGNLSYKPNYQSMLWFIDEILPKIREKVSDAQLTVAGSDPPEFLQTRCRQAGVNLEANPPDIGELYKRAGLVIVPIQLGSGTRIKILEAGAYGLPVVSTAKGAEGLGFKNGQELLIAAENSDDFAATCLKLLSDSNLRDSLGGSLRRAVSQNFERNAVIGNTANLFKSVMDTSGGACS